MCRSGSGSYETRMNRERRDVNKVFSRIGIAAVVLLVSGSAFAGQLKLQRPGHGLGNLGLGNIAMDAGPEFRPEYRVAQSDEDGNYDDGSSAGSDIVIRPREAARIARSVMPGSRVLKVKLLPSGIYAVTLRGGGELTRVMVDGRSGEIL
jgi:hypothetical protein